MQHLRHNPSGISPQHAPTLPTEPMGALLRTGKILHPMLQSLRELHILGEGMHREIAVALAVRAVAFDRDALLLALRLFGVQGRGEGHVVADSAAVAVQVVGCFDAVGERPGDFWGPGCGLFLGRHLSAVVGLSLAAVVAV